MHPPPEALADALAGRYRLERELGCGGMATVYLARDLKHDRDVAIKVLKQDVAAAIGVERFLAEIRTTARLKHPHILPLFDSGSASGTLYYVMPYVDGESLRGRLRREGRLGVGSAVALLRQVAGALAYAHAHGVLHRDVKPDNVLVADREAFLADFGIARAFVPQDPAATATGSAVAVGTPAYMAPEQLVGGSVDQRSDIYAFGALAYELLTGSPPFSGSPQDVAAACLTRAPEPLARRAVETPGALATLVMQCLQKAPEARPARMEDVEAVLDRVADAGLSRGRGRSSTALLVPATAAALVLVALGVAWYRRTTSERMPSLSVGRLTHVTTEPGLELDPSLSPDGRLIAYVAGAPGHMRIFVRELTGGRAIQLVEAAGDVTQRWPQWSPDATRIVFESGPPSIVSSTTINAGLGALYVTTPLGGSARAFAISGAGPQASTPSWSPDGRQIVFSDGEALYTAPVDGAAPARRLASGLDLHSPRWSPDGAMIAYVVQGSLFTFGADALGNVSNSTLMAVSLSDGQAHRLTDGDALDTSPAWMPDSRTLLFVSSRGGGRDVYRMHLASDATRDADPQRLTSGTSAHGIAVSRDGRLLLYSSYASNANIWSIPIPDDDPVSVSDAQQVTFGNEKIEKLTVSHDGRWLAYDSDVNGPADVWKMPLGDNGRADQVTHGPFHKFVNDWSPDGSELVFHSIQEGGQRDLFVVSADGTRTERVTSGPAEEQHAGWGPDGNSIAFDLTPPSGGQTQAYIVRRAARGSPWGRPQQLTRHGSTDPKWSPDGKWIAFCVAGQLRLIAPDGSGEHAIVDARSDGGEPQYAVWAPDSATVYYKSYDSERRSSIRSVPAAGGPTRLLVRFDVPSRRSVRREFATDGRRLFFTIARDESDIWALELVGK